ncbi:TadE/TadG family type IV pilus assembly protein [Kribbella sp. NPDC004875]|uniref:TadE/TadG family type IV pilus assembly protein n=1 Tax=Kribbella sp. NPDC004875 TaxID=3364107 RepID=UPI0036B62359
MYPRRGQRGGETHHGRTRIRLAARVRRRLPSSVHGGSSADRGATAVEFALLLPLLLLVVMGIVDFGRMLNAQESLTQAAREGARLVALGQDPTARTQAAAGALSPVGVSTLTTCPKGAGGDGSVRVTYSFAFTPGFGSIASLFGGNGLGGQVTLTARGVMPCET